MSFFQQYRSAWELQFFKKFLFICYAAISLIPSALLLGIFLFVFQSKYITWIAGLLAIIGIIFSFWYSRVTAYYMVIEKLSFGKAFQHTFFPLIMKLSFLPIIGGFFEKLIKDEHKNPFVENSQS